MEQFMAWEMRNGGYNLKFKHRNWNSKSSSNKCSKFKVKS